MLSDLERLELHLAEEKPSHWSALIMNMAEVNPEKALYAADLVRTQEVENGFPTSSLCLVATATIQQIQRITPARIVPGPVKSSHGFFRNAQTVAKLIRHNRPV